ncbi:hypothetical protein EVAR_48610_1 [Eumeta japonica]|uniref:Uncharacterized protein n=1 Tax=Eumeta variegata TaxID=151549 RepID=A0A4C1Y1G2_EUMVA|nr:hypothetical protein EVAR_48610_1 [Eumeta japonica]
MRPPPAARSDIKAIRSTVKLSKRSPHESAVARRNRLPARPRPPIGTPPSVSLDHGEALKKNSIDARWARPASVKKLAKDFGSRPRRGRRPALSWAVDLSTTSDGAAAARPTRPPQIDRAPAAPILGLNAKN